MQKCAGCDTLRHHPRPVCFACGSFDFTWEPMSGRGVLYTFTIVHNPTLASFQHAVPYNVAVVQLDEGPYLVSNVVDCANDELSIGMALEVVFEIVDPATTLPRFRRMAEKSTGTP
jgi:uncharacterized protein